MFLIVEVNKILHDHISRICAHISSVLLVEKVSVFDAFIFQPSGIVMDAEKVKSSVFLLVGARKVKLGNKPTVRKIKGQLVNLVCLAIKRLCLCSRKQVTC